MNYRIRVGKLIETTLEGEVVKYSVVGGSFTLKELEQYVEFLRSYLEKEKKGGRP